jgi:hypothetical protein
MSTKTIKQRIALVAVTALTAGFLSVVSAPASNAALSNEAPGTASPSAGAQTLNIATTTNTSGVAVLSNTVSALSSVGLLATGDIAGTRKADTTQTATLLNTGTLVVYTSQSTTNVAMISVTGGRIVNTQNSEAINSGLTAAAAGANVIASGSNFAVAIQPSTGSTSMIVKLNVAGSGSASDIINGTTTGTLYGQINVTIATASAAGVVSALTSGVYYSTDHTTANLSLTSDVATSGIGTYNNNVTATANIRARDAYGTALSAGLLTAQATNGALVDITAANSSGSPVGSTDFYTSAPDNTVLSVIAPSTAPLSTVVTVQYGGVTIATKSFTFRGVVSKITLSAPYNGLNGNSDSGGPNTATIVFQDSAGNNLSIDNTATPASRFATSALGTGLSSTLSLSTAPTSSTGRIGVVTFTCPSLSGSAKVAAQYTNTDGTVITSNMLDVTCSKIAYRYTASYDKATYAPGEVMTLTVSFTDVDGRAAADSLTSTSDNATHAAAVITDSGQAKVGAAHAGDDTRTTNGKIAYKYIAGQTEGSYTNSISFPTVNTTGAAAGVGPVTAGFTIKSATATVTNADVLKSIVSLIASINKQIQALQKLILKR